MNVETLFFLWPEKRELETDWKLSSIQTSPPSTQMKEGETSEYEYFVHTHTGSLQPGYTRVDNMKQKIYPPAHYMSELFHESTSVMSVSFFLPGFLTTTEIYLRTILFGAGGFLM